MELYPAYLLLLGLGMLAAVATLSRRFEALGVCGYRDIVHRLPPTFLIVLSVSSAVYHYGWLPVYVYLVSAVVVLGVLRFMKRPDVGAPDLLERWLKSMYLMLVASATITALAESGILSSPLLLTIPLVTVFTQIRRKGLAPALGLVILLAGVAAGSVMDFLPTSLSQILRSQDSIWIVVLSIYLILVSSSPRDILTPGLKVLSIPVVAVLILIGLGVALTPVTGLLTTSGALKPSGQPPQTLPLIMSFSALSVWPWITWERSGGGPPKPWIELALGLLAVPLYAAVAVEGDGFGVSQTAVEDILSHIFGDFAKPLIGKTYGLALSLAGLTLIATSLKHLIGYYAGPMGLGVRQLTAAASLIPIYLIAIVDGWREILPYAGGVGLLAFSIMLVRAGGSRTAIIFGLGVYVFTASTLIWLSLAELSTLQNMEMLISTVPPILSLAGSAIAGILISRMLAEASRRLEA
ncbi:MAG: hypothetical protein QXK39_01715 [Nitrososphaerota archaeon]